jgi:hypothetical protein
LRPHLSDSLGLVVIGRNLEGMLGETLSSCPPIPHRVYVDSGSQDQSVSIARSLGWDVVEVEPPFTAAKARNAGAHHLLRKAPSILYLQMLDGDCCLCENWLETAQRHLESVSERGAVFGQRRERDPRRNIFHRVTDWEWCQADQQFGGEVMMTTQAFTSVNGYTPTMVAGEDIDLSVRIRSAGWQVSFLPLDMSIHDIKMDSWLQWWKRNVRSGHAYAELLWRHGKRGIATRETLSIWLWTLLLPGIAYLKFGAEGWLTLLLLQLLRICWNQRKSGLSPADALSVASHCLCGKWPMLIGQLRFWLFRIVGRKSRILEYQSEDFEGHASKV